MHSIDSRLIRVFISSTFRDMQDERDELMKKTFPMLRRKAAERDVTLTELDLRWGITPEESQSGKVVEICFREIENSVPFFIGIIGNRYGWVPSADEIGESVKTRFEQVGSYVERKLSVTEMEMQFGVLERPENIHAYFFIKEQETDDVVDEPEKLAALKSAVRRNGRYPVSTYSSPEDLALQVENAFTKLLDELYPEVPISELEKERIGQRAYLNSLCSNYIKTRRYFTVLDMWLANERDGRLLITSGDGIGKSALIANWLREKLSSGEACPYNIVYLFIGIGGSHISSSHITKLLCEEIRCLYKLEKETDEVEDGRLVLDSLFSVISAPGYKPLLIVLDAFDQIRNDCFVDEWLPTAKRGIKYLFSSPDNCEATISLQVGGITELHLTRLRKAQRAELIRSYLAFFSKKLRSDQVDRIVNDRQCGNTRVLKTLLDELINFGVYEKLDERIDSYLGQKSLEDFYQVLLKSYERDFEEDVVRHLLSLIWTSPGGLTEIEIQRIAGISQYRWSMFYCSFITHLINKDGLISFAHRHIWKAIKERYIDNHIEWSSICRLEIIDYFQKESSCRANIVLSYLFAELGKDHDDYNYFNKSLEFYLKAIKEEPRIAHDCYYPFDRDDIVFIWAEKSPNHPQKSITFKKKILAELGQVWGDNSIEVSVISGGLASEYTTLNDYQEALEYRMKELDSEPGDEVNNTYICDDIGNLFEKNR